MTTTTGADDLASIEQRLRVSADHGRFSEEELVGLPEPVARYFNAAIAPGAPLARAADIDMRGKLKLNGRWLPLRAHEVLAPHEGFVWRARVAGVISGSDRCVDGRGVMDWKLLRLFRVARAEGADIARSSAARAVGEAVWVPTALLPRFGVQWQAISERDITANLDFEGLAFAIHLRTDEVGRVESVQLDRWGDPDESGEFAFHSFGMETTETTTFGPFTVPAVVRVGWFPGTERWADGEFIRCDVTSLTPIGPAGTESTDDDRD